MHTDCSCPNCVGIVLAEHYITSPWYYLGYQREAWTDNRQDKSRRIALIRSVWHLSRDSPLATLVHTTYFGQESVAYASWANQFHNRSLRTGRGSTQGTLNLLD